MITPPELDEAAAFLKSKLAEIEGSIKEIKAKVDDVCSRWEGAAQQAFIAQFENEMYPLLKDTFPQVIDGVSQELSAAATTMREADESLASAMKG